MVGSLFQREPVTVGLSGVPVLHGVGLSGVVCFRLPVAVGPLRTQ